MARSHLAVLVVLVCMTVAAAVPAAIIGPGEYSGVVIFDRWGGCTLCRGVFVMHIDEAIKETLKAYAGKSVRLDAVDVYQPMNPGDARIDQFKYLGPVSNAGLPGLKLSAEAAFEDGQKPAYLITIRNDGTKPVTVNSDYIAPTVLMYQSPDGQTRSFSRSNGPSVALMTKMAFWDWKPRWQSGTGWVNYGRAYSWTIGKEQALPGHFTLKPKSQKQIKIWFGLDPGRYEFLCGYGGWRDKQCIASNLVAFDVEKEKRGKRVSVPGRDLPVKSAGPSRNLVTRSP